MPNRTTVLISLDRRLFVTDAVNIEKRVFSNTSAFVGSTSSGISFPSPFGYCSVAIKGFPKIVLASIYTTRVSTGSASEPLQLPMRFATWTTAGKLYISDLNFSWMSHNKKATFMSCLIVLNERSPTKPAWAISRTKQTFPRLRLANLASAAFWTMTPQHVVYQPLTKVKTEESLEHCLSGTMFTLFEHFLPPVFIYLRGGRG